ncbi:MAG: hypothetical protein NXI01_03535 [Gammaproteobacteria bacterium]|nr:hypothetical protein [Gammaproteobacteria bacterium]
MAINSVLGYLGTIYGKESPKDGRTRTCFETVQSFEDLPKEANHAAYRDTLFAAGMLPIRPPSTGLDGRFSSNGETPFVSSSSSNKGSPEGTGGYYFGSPAISLDQPESLSSPKTLPIHEILSEIQQHLIDITEDEAEADASDVRRAAVYFTPLVLHYWELLRLAEMLRCQIKESLAKPYQLHCLQEKCNRLEQKLQDIGPDSKEYPALMVDKSELERDMNVLKQEISKRAAESKEEQLAVKEALQSALVLTTVLNIVLRQGMSANWLGDLWKLEDQRDEYRDMLSVFYGIDFGFSFRTLFSKTSSVVETKQDRIEVNGISTWITSILSKLYQWLNDHVAMQRGIQSFHRAINPWRLALLRMRREGVFFMPLLNSEAYNTHFNEMNGYVRPFLAYFNWLFFLPRLMLNFSLLGHHTLNDANLTLLEKNLDRTTRFRAHWTRFWFELISDIGRFSNGISLCLFVAGGAMSPTGVIIRVLIQVFELALSIVRAGVEMHRLYAMSCALGYNPLKDDPKSSMQLHLKERMKFEAGALGYTMAHFWILLIATCMTLPSMAAVSLMWPVIGGAITILMIGITAHKTTGSKDGFVQTRQRLFETKAAFYKRDGDEERTIECSPSQYVLSH